MRAKAGEIEARQDLDEALKTQILDSYRLARDSVEAAEGHAADARSYWQAIQSAPTEIARLRRALEIPESAGPAGAPVGDLPLAELELRLLAAQVDVARLESQRDDRERLIQEQQGRTPERITDDLTAARQNLEAIERDLGGQPRPEESPLLLEARRVALHAHKQARTNEIHKLEQELLSRDVRIALLIAQRDQVAQEALVAGIRSNGIGEIIAQRRQIETESTQLEAERARLQAVGKHPAVGKLAEQNATWSRELATVVKRLDKATAEREATSERLERIEQDFRSVKQKLDIAGLSQALGQVLREERRKLPEVRWYNRAAEERQQTIAELGLKPLVMADPEPAVVIVGFSEGAVHFEARVFVKELGHRDVVHHELRLTIHDAFRAHNIQTPLPERNVHVRSFVSTPRT